MILRLSNSKEGSRNSHFQKFPSLICNLSPEGDDDESSPITFVRGINLERLAIEAFIDLANPKLTARFQDSESSSISAPGSAKGKTNESQPPKAKSSKWSEEDAQWASNEDIEW